MLPWGSVLNLASLSTTLLLLFFLPDKAAPPPSPLHSAVSAPPPVPAELGRAERSARCACKDCAAHAALSYPSPAFFPLPPIPIVMESRHGECDYCWSAADEHPNPCELLSARRSWNPDPHIREALVSALLPCAMRQGTCNMLDLGANFGLFSMWGWLLGAQVVAVEPQIDLGAALARTVALNCAAGDVRVLNQAVTPDAGQAGKPYTSNVVGFRQCDPEELESVPRATDTQGEVPFVFLDDLLLERPVWQLVKCDIDWHDPDLLQRMMALVEAKRVDIRNILIEWNDGRGLGSMIPQLHALNYTVYKLNVHDNRRVFNARGVDVASHFGPIGLESFFDEVYGPRAIQFSFKVKRGLPKEAYDEMLANDIPELFITRDEMEEPVHVNEKKARVADRVPDWDPARLALPEH